MLFLVAESTVVSRDHYKASNKRKCHKNLFTMKCSSNSEMCTVHNCYIRRCVVHFLFTFISCCYWLKAVFRQRVIRPVLRIDKVSSVSLLKVNGLIFLGHPKDKMFTKLSSLFFWLQVSVFGLQ